MRGGGGEGVGGGGVRGWGLEGDIVLVRNGIRAVMILCFAVSIYYI